MELGLAVPHAHIDEANVPRGKNYYEHMLELCEKFFDGEIDSQTFEESLRYMWGIKAFPAFTVDKVSGLNDLLGCCKLKCARLQLVLSIIKHVHSINGDTRHRQLLALLKRDREVEKRTVKHQIIYRHACEEVMGTGDNLYRIEWVSLFCILWRESVPDA